MVRDFFFLGFKITLDDGCRHEIKNTCSLEDKIITNLESKTETLFADKGLPSQGYGFSGSHVRMGELDHKES